MCAKRDLTSCLLCQCVKVTPIFVRLILALEHIHNNTIDILVENGSFLEADLFVVTAEIENCKYQPNEKRGELDTLTQ